MQGWRKKVWKEKSSVARHHRRTPPLIFILLLQLSAELLNTQNSLRGSLKILSERLEFNYNANNDAQPSPFNFSFVISSSRLKEKVRPKQIKI